jgi:hypothetical protein
VTAASTIVLKLEGQVQRLFPRGRTAVITLPSVGPGRSFAVATADPGESLADVFERTAANQVRPVGKVTNVRGSASGGAEVTLRITNGEAWLALASDRRVMADCAFLGMAPGAAPDPIGGQVLRVEI